MTSHTTRAFRQLLHQLPESIRHAAEKRFRLWQSNPLHKSLRFKKIHATQEIYSIRVALDYRALALKEGETFIWFWIGSHADYDKLISRQ